MAGVAQSASGEHLESENCATGGHGLSCVQYWHARKYHALVLVLHPGSSGVELRVHNSLQGGASKLHVTQIQYATSDLWASTPPVVQACAIALVSPAKYHGVDPVDYEK